MADRCLIVSDVTKTYGSTVAVAHVSFVARPGRTTAILGPRRSGKTTMVQLLLGYLQPTAGSVTITDDEEVSARVPAGQVAGVLPDAGDTINALTGHLSIRGFLRAECHERGLPGTRVNPVLDLVELAAAEYCPISMLTPEHLRRVAIAAALLDDTKILVIDEPAAGYTAGDVRWLANFLKTMSDSGHTVVITARTASHARLLADDVVPLDGDRVGSVDPDHGDEPPRTILVRTPSPTTLVAALDATASVLTAPNGDLYITGPSAHVIGETACRCAVVLHQLVTCDRPLVSGLWPRTNVDS